MPPRPATQPDPTPGSPDAMLRWLATLADATRLRLLRLTERHELGVTDLCGVLQLPQSTVSRHLKLLGDEGWIVSRRQATNNLYRTRPDELDPAQRELWTLTRERTASWATLAQDDVRLAARLAERAEDSRAFFDDAASHWDRTRDELYGTAFSFEALLSLLPGDWTVADLGCGTGRLATQLAPHVKQVIGIDNSPAMLKAAAAATKRHKNIELKQGELTALPLGDASCDAALCVLVLTYVEDPAAVLREMRRIVKPAPGGNGKAIIVDLLQHDRDDFRRGLGQRSLGFGVAALRRLLTDAGFTHAHCRPLPPTTHAKGPALLLASAW